MVHANQFSNEHLNFFMDAYRNRSGQNEAVMHGISLGLGLVGMATKDENIYNQLRDILFNNADSAIKGEAAAYSIGLVMTGSANEAVIDELMAHA